MCEHTVSIDDRLFFVTVLCEIQYVTETNPPQKRLPARPQPFVIQFTDGFQSLSQTLVVAHPLLDLKALLGTNAELPGSSLRVG